MEFGVINVGWQVKALGLIKATPVQHSSCWELRGVINHIRESQTHTLT